MVERIGFGIRDHNRTDKSRYKVYDGFADEGWFYTNKKDAMKKAVKMLDRIPYVFIYQVKKEQFAHEFIGRLVKDIGLSGERAKWIPRYGRPRYLNRDGSFKR